MHIPCFCSLFFAFIVAYLFIEVPSAGFCKKKGKITKEMAKMKIKSNTYLTHFYLLPRSLERLEKYRNTKAFSQTCAIQQLWNETEVMLADSASGDGKEVGWILMDVYSRRLD